MNNQTFQERLLYETDNWPAYEKSMSSGGYTLIERYEVGKNQKTGDENSYTGDGLWRKDDIDTYRDFKTGGKKFGFAVSEKSLSLFKENGIYDFCDIYGTFLRFSVPKSEVIKLYNSGNFFRTKGDKQKKLVRFDYNIIKNLSEN